jgi:flagellar motility protein MotE (MotC chaperone)
VHEKEPITFRVRWAMSYLRGPLTRNEIQRLMEGRRDTSGGTASAPKVPAAGGEGERPLLPPEVPQTFLPASGAPRDLVYRAFLLGEGRVHFVDSRRDIQSKEDVLLLAALEDEVEGVDWYAARPLDLSSDHLEDEPVPGAAFGPLVSAGGEEKSYRTWSKSFSDALYRDRRLKLWKSPTYKEVSQPEESERDFRIRLGQLAREARDEQTEELREKYAKKLETLEDRIRRAEQKVEVQAEQARDQKLKTVVNIGSTLLGAFLGRKRLSSSRLGTAVKGFGRQARESQDVERAKEDLAVLEEKYREMERELEQEIEELEERFDPLNEELETFAVKPRRTDVEVRRVALVWVPYRKTEEGLEEAWG